MKKLFAVLLALTFVLSLGTATFAAEDGTITIGNVVKGSDYSIYKMLDFTPSGEDTGIYTIVDGWEAFFEGETAQDYFDVVTNGEQTTVVLKTDVKAVDQKLAMAAVEYAIENDIDATATKTAESTTSVVFEGLDLGYYAINTTVGTFCNLTNTNSKDKVNEKNGVPGIDKWVKEDSTGDWVKVNDADIDQVVEYKSTITAGLGVTNYVMHDTMDKGLTFNYDTAEDADNSDVFYVMIGDELVDPANYTVVVNPADGHTFDVQFDNEFILGLNKGTQITVYYSATLNEDAYVVDKSNDNEVYLSYGEEDTWESEKDYTYTYTWKMDVLKYTEGEDDAKLPLAGAKFQLVGADGVIKFTKVADAEVPTYVVDKDGDVTTIETDNNGKFEIIGLDEGEYNLVETEAPEGYNMLPAPIPVEITSQYNVEGFDGMDADVRAFYEINDATPAVIEVLNETGSLLPETGGIGTTIFTVGGSILMIAAVIILVTKKRMANFG